MTTELYHEVFMYEICHLTSKPLPSKRGEGKFLVRILQSLDFLRSMLGVNCLMESFFYRPQGGGNYWRPREGVEAVARSGQLLHYCSMSASFRVSPDVGLGQKGVNVGGNVG